MPRTSGYLTGSAIPHRLSAFRVYPSGQVHSFAGCVKVMYLVHD
jgi:hypothetical protein